MLFDKKIKYIVEALGDPQTIGGYKPQSNMTEKDFQESLVKFNSQKPNYDPNLLRNAIEFVKQGIFKDEQGKPKDIKNVHFKLPTGPKAFSWKGANEFEQKVIERYFTEGSKNYINFPKTEGGSLPNNKTFQAILSNKPEEYPEIQNLPVVWLGLIKELLNLEMEASDARQLVQPDTFWYLTGTKQRGPDGIEIVPPLKLKKGRISISDNGTIPKQPFGGNTTYRNMYQAFTPKGQKIDYKEIAGGISFDKFKQILHSDQAKKAAGVGI
jgi:hypothetical protein